MLERLSLINFKAFDDVEVPMGRLTLLSGLNGSGKSSILQALGVLRQSNDSGALQGGELSLNGPLVAIGTGRDLVFQDFEASEVGIGLKVGTAGEGDWLDWVADVAPDADVLTCRRMPDSLYDLRTPLLGDGFQFLRADRITPSVTFPKSQHSIGRGGFLGARGEYAAHYLLRFGSDLDVASMLRIPEESAHTLIAQVNAWMQTFSPGVRVEPHAIPMTDLVRLAYSFRGRQAAYSDPLRPTNVGFGLTHALPVVTACLASVPGSLIAIENPEAQLHPRGQFAMGRLLALTAANGVQVVVETHSDHVLNGIRLMVKHKLLDPGAAQLHFFSRVPGAGASFESPVLDVEGRLSFWPEGFFDQWERSLDELLG